jgi:uncharacterized protein (DUF924 family)
MTDNETVSAEPADVLDFWKEAGRKRWFKQDNAFDREIADQFLALHEQASSGTLHHWTSDADSSLALVLVLDQFSRNLFRDSPRAFAQDAAAREIAGAAIRHGFDDQFDADMKAFFYLPFEHSECLVDQDRSVGLFHSTGDSEFLAYAIVHRGVIRRFSRFPHRNSVLGRHTSPAEQAFLDAGGFSG